MKSHKTLLFGLVFFALLLGITTAKNTFNPETGDNNTSLYFFLAGAGVITLGGYYYLNSTKKPKNDHNSSLSDAIVPGVGSYMAGQTASVLQSQEVISELQTLSGYIHKIKKEPILDNGWKYTSSRVSSGLYDEETRFLIRWDLPHTGQDFPHLNVEGVEGAENLNHMPLDFYPDSKTALRAYASSKGKETLSKIVKEGKITSEDVDILNYAIKELSPEGIGIKTVKTGLPVSIAVSLAYNGYEVYTGKKDLNTAGVDVAEDTASSAVSLYVAGEVFATCMESGGAIGLEAGTVACAIAGIGAGIATDTGVRSLLESLEGFISPDEEYTTCLMSMNEKRTVSIDCKGNKLFPELYSIDDDNIEFSLIDKTTNMNQKITVSPDHENWKTERWGI